MYKCSENSVLLKSYKILKIVFFIILSSLLNMIKNLIPLLGFEILICSLGLDLYF